MITSFPRSKLSVNVSLKYNKGINDFKKNRIYDFTHMSVKIEQYSIHIRKHSIDQTDYFVDTAKVKIKSFQS